MPDPKRPGDRAVALAAMHHRIESYRDLSAYLRKRVRIPLTISG